MRRSTPVRSRRTLALVAPLVGDGLAQLQANWRHHALTLVGVVWGAAAVILLVSLGSGFHTFLDLGFQKTGDHWSHVMGRYTSSETGGARPGRAIRFTLDDYDRLRAGVPSAREIAAIHDGWGRVARTSHHTRSNGYVFTTPGLQSIQKLPVARGRFFDEEDGRLRQRVVVLGANLPEIFLGSTDPIGELLEIDGHPFRVIGVLARKGPQIVASDDGLHDDLLFVPLQTAQAAFGLGDSVEAFYVDPFSTDEIEPMHDQIRAALWPAHHLSAEDEHAIQIRSITEASGPAKRIGLGLQVLLGVIGTMTLTMAGVGVANLMVAGVNQRRTEVGLRRACGARRSDVTLQFLVETLVVVLAGGAIGVALGVAIVSALGLLPLPAGAPLPRLSANVLLTTFAVLVAVGFASGVAPARVAAQMDPSSALRLH